MNRYTLGKIVKFFFHWHYDVQVVGEELLRDKSTHLVLPNHTAYIDPLILFSEMWWLPISPMVDELFIRYVSIRRGMSRRWIRKSSATAVWPMRSAVNCRRRCMWCYAECAVWKAVNGRNSNPRNGNGAAR